MSARPVPRSLALSRSWRKMMYYHGVSSWRSLTTAPPRSVTDATRFTPQTPHANTKVHAPLRSSFSSRSSKHNGSSATSPQPSPPRSSTASSSSSSATATSSAVVGETPAQRVARLRAAHLAARNATTSPYDQVIIHSRSFFDILHRVAQRTLLAITAIAFIFTVYAAYDMVQFNKKRMQDFKAAQEGMEADSLEAARLAFIEGKATDEQVQMVEEALQKAREQGTTLPPLLTTPAPKTGGETVVTAISDKMGVGRKDRASNGGNSVWDSVEEKLQSQAQESAEPTAAPPKKKWSFW